MSGWSDSSDCPKCDGQMIIYGENKPYDKVGGYCLECEFNYWTQDGQMTLEEVNELRKDYDLGPPKELKKTRAKIKGGK